MGDRLGTPDAVGIPFFFFIFLVAVSSQASSLCTSLVGFCSDSQHESKPFFFSPLAFISMKMCHLRDIFIFFSVFLSRLTAVGSVSSQAWSLCTG